MLVHLESSIGYAQAPRFRARVVQFFAYMSCCRLHEERSPIIDMQIHKMLSLPVHRELSRKQLEGVIVAVSGFGS